MNNTFYRLGVICVALIVLTFLITTIKFSEYFTSEKCLDKNAQCAVQPNTGFVGLCHCRQTTNNVQECCQLCNADQPQCVGFTYDSENNLCMLKTTITDQVADKRLTSGTVKPPPLPVPTPVAPPQVIDTDSLYTITDHFGIYQMAWGLGSSYALAMYQNCKDQNKCLFRFVSRSLSVEEVQRSRLKSLPPLYSIETADGTGRLVMQNKTAQGGLQNRNPVVVYSGLQETCPGAGLSKDCLFKVSLSETGDNTWKIEAADCSGILSILDLTSKWKPIYDNPQTRSQADELPVAMRTTGNVSSCGYDCEFKFVKAGTASQLGCQYTNTFNECTPGSIFIQNCHGQYLSADQGQAANWVSQPTAKCCYELIDPPFAPNTGNPSNGGAGNGSATQYPPNSFSLESVAYPGYFMRQFSGVMRLDANYTGQDSDDFVFQFIPAMNGQPNSFSIRPTGAANNQSCFFSQGQSMQFQTDLCSQSDPEFANAASFNVGTSVLKGQNLCNYTTTFSGCQENSIYVQNCKGQYLLPVQGQWTPNWTSAPTTACCFNVVNPPFGGQYAPNSYSIESVAFPGYFLRHSDFVIRIDNNYTQQNNDFVFQFVPGVGGEPNTFSLRPSQSQWNNSCLTSVGSTLQFQSGLACPQTTLTSNIKASFNLGTSKLTPMPPIFMTVDTKSLYTIENADGSFRLSIVGLSENGLSNQMPIAMIQSSYANCGGGGADCTFKFGDLGNGLYSIETADGAGRLAMWGKTAQGGLLNQNPIFVYSGSQDTCNGNGASQDCAFRIFPNPDQTWRIEAGDGSGRMAFWNWTSQWREVYADPLTRSQANQLSVFMYTGNQQSCNGDDCSFKLVKVTPPKTRPYVAFDQANGDCSGMNSSDSAVSANPGETAAQLVARCSEQCNASQSCRGFSSNGNICYLKTQNCGQNPYGRTQNGFTFYYNPETTSYIAYDSPAGDCSGQDGNLGSITINQGESRDDFFSRCEKNCDSVASCQGFSFDGMYCDPKVTNCAITPYGRTQNGFNFYYKPTAATQAAITSQAAPTPQEAPTDTCVSGAECPQTLTSKNGTARLTLQSDHNLVAYNSNNEPMWATGTNGQGASPVAWKLDNTGNLLVIDGNGQVLWQSGTGNRGTAPYKLIVQNDHNICIYDNNNTFIWATWTENK